MDRPVTCLRGVGEKTADLLRVANIRTVQDVLSYSGGPVPGIRSIEKIREKARDFIASLQVSVSSDDESKSKSHTISSHSWRDVTVHYRHDHRMYRGVIRHLVVKSNVVGLLVEYPSKHREKNYVLQSPMLIYHLHQEWIRQGYVTDDSDDEHEYPGGNEPPSMYLPPLLPDRDELEDKFPEGTPDRRSIDFYLREINSLYHHYAESDLSNMSRT